MSGRLSHGGGIQSRAVSAVLGCEPSSCSMLQCCTWGGRVAAPGVQFGDRLGLGAGSSTIFSVEEAGLALLCTESLSLTSHLCQLFFSPKTLDVGRLGGFCVSKDDCEPFLSAYPVSNLLIIIDTPLGRTGLSASSILSVSLMFSLSTISFVLYLTTGSLEPLPAVLEFLLAVTIWWMDAVRPRLVEDPLVRGFESRLFLVGETLPPSLPSL